jgi:endogenous inhibitor of DNA gyrase (YacG/DUF329 family)
MNNVHCSICDRPLIGRGRDAWPWFPFCSERCRSIDLGRWLGGAYRIPVEGREEAPAANADDLDLP